MAGHHPFHQLQNAAVTHRRPEHSVLRVHRSHAGGRQEHVMPGETAVIPLQSLLVKGQLASALRREDLILDGTDDLPSLVHEQNVQPTAAAIQHGVPFPLRCGIRPCAASNAILVNGGCSQTRAALDSVEQEVLKEINPGAVAPPGVQQPGQAPGVKRPPATTGSGARIG